MPDDRLTAGARTGDASPEWSSPSDISLGDVVGAVRRRKGAILSCLGISMVLALWLSPSVDRSFRSEATVLVDISPTGDLTEALQGARLSKGALDTYIEMATSDVMLQRVADATSAGRTTDEIRAAISARHLQDTLIVEIRAVDEDRVVAVQLAADASRAFVELVHDFAVRNGLEPRSAIIDQASDARRTVSHSRKRDLAVGAGTGLMAGAIVALGREAMDTRVRTRGDVAAAVGTCLASAPSDAREVIPELLAAIRSAATGSVRSIAVVSAEGGEGKTTLVGGLALGYAASGATTVVVDATLDGQLTTTTGSTGRRGLSNVLRGQVDVRDCLILLDADVWFVPTGEDLGDVIHLLGSERMRNALWLLELQIGTVVVDTSAFARTASTYGVATRVDGVVVLAREGATPVRGLARVASRLTRVAAPPLGGVLVPRRLRPAPALAAIGEGGLRGPG